MSKLSELLPAGGGGKQVDFVASGTLGSGKTVILNSDGTVSLVGESSGAGVVIPYGSEAVFDSTTAIYYSAVAFDPNAANVFVVAWKGSTSNYGMAAVGTVSGSSISFGTAVVFNSGASNDNSISFDPNTANKFVIVYVDDSNGAYCTAVVGTRSGTSVSFGSEIVFSSTNNLFTNVAFDPNTAGKFVATFKNRSNSNYGTAVVGTVSGSSISFGTAVVFNAGASNDNSISFDPNTSSKFVIAYNDGAGKCIIGTRSGTSTSFGTAVTFNASSSLDVKVDFDPNTAGKLVVSYRNGGNSNYGTAIVGTMSGTSVSFGTASIFNSATVNFSTVAFDPNTANRFVIAYSDGANANYATAIVGTVSGTSISYSSKYVIEDSYHMYTSISFDPNTSGNFVTSYRDNGHSGYGRVSLGDLTGTVVTTNLTSTNFLGITDAAVASGATGSVTVKGGVSTNLSSLAIGSTYYVQPAGTLATSAGTPSVEAGKAISATSLILKG